MTVARRPRVAVDLRPYFKGEERGHTRKSLVVLHETVSHNAPGTGDIKGIAAFMDSTGLEIHGVVDIEGNSGWCYDPTAIYDHAASGAGNVNTRSIGFEQVSEIPFLKTVAERRAAWKAPERRKQLDTVAQWCAFLSVTQGIPLNFSKGDTPGVTTHWNVSQTFLKGDGHWDCWPTHLGGHYPAMYVVYRARQIRKAWESA